MNINWFDEDVYKMLLRLGINFFFLTLIIRFTYYRVSRRKDYLFTYYLLGSIVFFICFSLKKLDIDTGMGLGLFAIFSIIRYRTSQIDIREMTYLFLVIGLSVVNALASKKISMIELGIVNSFIFGLTYFLEFGWQVRSETQKLILLKTLSWFVREGRPNSKRSWSGAPDSPSKEWKSGRSIFWTIRLRSGSFITAMSNIPHISMRMTDRMLRPFRVLRFFGSFFAVCCMPLSSAGRRTKPVPHHRSSGPVRQ